MSLFFPSYLRVDLWLRRAPLIGMGLCVFAMLMAGVSWLWYGLYARERHEASQELFLSSTHPFPLESIGQGALSLRPSQAMGWIARLYDEVQVLAYNSRPDQSLKEAEMVVHLKQGKERCVVPSGKMLYLKESGQGQGLLPSQEEAPLWVKLTLLDGASVLVEAGRRCMVQGVGESEERGQFVAHVQGLRGAAPSQFQEGLKALMSSVAFAQDLVISKYGGREFSDWSRKVILEVQGPAGVYGVRVAQGDYLTLQEGEWTVVPFETVKERACVGQVVAASDRFVELVVWDDKGFSPSQFKIDVKKSQLSAFGADLLPSLVRLRTGTQVSAAFGKRRLILKQGDWLVKRQNGWRHLRSADEMQLYLDRRLQGELFVFESMEKDAQGKYVLKGTLFDATRTYMQSINVPINQERQHNGKSLSKRRSGMNRGGK